jgi:ankyrin repeat protein
MSKSSGSVRVLPAHPSLDHLKKEAKRLLDRQKKTNPKMKLAEAQLELARGYGFTSWRALKVEVEARMAAQQEVGPVNEKDVAALLSAVGTGDLIAAKALIAKDVRVVKGVGAHPLWGGRPQPLHVAIERGDREMFDLLLAHGADVNGDNAGYGGWSPLMLAVHWKQGAIAQELIKRGAKIGFAEALLLGDDAKVERMIAEEPGVIQAAMPGGGGTNPLHFVRTAKAAELLIAMGVPLEVRDVYGRTPVEVAAARSPVEKELLKVLSGGAGVHPGVLVAVGNLEALKAAAEADPKCLDGEYMTDMQKLPLLHIAAQNGHLAVMQWLLDKGQDVNKPSQRKATPLHVASWMGRVEVGRELVARGASLSARDDEYGATPLDWASTALERLDRKECGAMVDFLEEAMAPKKAKSKGAQKKVKVGDWKPIMDAAYAGDAVKIRRLVSQGADPNVLSTTNHRHRPLHRAVERKKTYPRTQAHDQAVRALLDGGADASMRAGYDSLTALALAATGEVRFVPILMEKYKPNDLYHACVLADEARVKAILKKDAGLAKTADENGWTPLHYCTNSAMFEKGKKECQALVSIARMLIKAGADTMATYAFEGDWPIPPLYGCCGKHDNPALARVLFEAGATPYDNETVYHATDEGHEHALKLIEEFANKQKLADECSKCLPTQLHWNHQKGMPWLLAHGADPNYQTVDAGETALHKAARNGANAQTIAMLLEHGAKVTVKNKKGQTPIDLAREAGKERVVAQLEEEGKSAQK